MEPSAESTRPPGRRSGKPGARQVRRPRGRPLLAAVGAVAAVALSGCTTTQHEAERVRLDSARLRAALVGTRVQAQGSAARATSIRLVRSTGRTAVIVTVRNLARREVTDLPISVGYVTPAGGRVYLNAGAGLGYYDSHLPAIRMGRTLTWVFTTSAAVPGRARLFALVGSHESVPARLTEPNVDLIVRAVRIGANARAVTVRLDNPTSVPQYQLQLYATAAAPLGGGYTAAGSATVPELGAGASQSVTVSLVGAARGARISVTAVPTVLQ